MQVDLNGRVALVTGAGNGIGKAIALALAANGADVAVNDVEDTALQTVEEIRQLGRKSIFLKADIRDHAAIEAMAEQAERELGPIYILVNNAGVGVTPDQRKSIHEFDVAEWHRIVDVDLDGLFYCCRAISPRMVERKAGVIINIASVMGQVPARLQIPYTAAKAAVINFSRSAALELAPFGIRVNAVAPGSVMTRGTGALFYNEEQQARAKSLLSHIPLGRAGTPEEIANSVVFLAAPEASYITGTVLTVDGGWTAGFSRDW